MKKVVLLTVCVLLLATFAPANTEPVMTTIEKVLDIERPKDVDILLLRNGDKLTGTVVNENFSIRTSYAHIVIESKYIAGINLEGGANNIESIITVNNNRFSGLVEDAFISFKLTSGQLLEIDHEYLLKLVFRQRPQETAGMKCRQFMKLKDGDYFHGQILSKDITISTAYAKILLDFENIESITLVGDSNPLATVKMTNEDTVQGTLEIEDIEIELDVGSVIEVYQDRIDRIFFKEGYVPDSISSIVTSIEAVKGNLVLVEKGSFTMGDTWGDGFIDEKPTHKVTFTYNFYIGKYETTFDEYDAFCEATEKSSPDDENWGRGNRPVINVSWNDAIAYCNWLSEVERLPKAYDSRGNLLDKEGSITTDPSKVVGYRLPTEAEWEYAARGGRHTEGYKYSGGDDVYFVAWHSENSGGHTHDVGTTQPNELGIYDMSGNVWEWCSDWYDVDYYATGPTKNPYNYNHGLSRVLRGGSWYNSNLRLRVAGRGGGISADQMGSDIGFRICRTVYKEINENKQYNEPRLVSPADGEEISYESVILSWEYRSTDGDELTYDVFFGKTLEELEKVIEDQKEDFAEIERLSNGTTYYWRVVVKDTYGGTTESPVWSFSTYANLSTYAPSNIVPPMVLVEKGVFTMRDEWGNGLDNEKPTLNVILTYDFYMGKYEVTFDEYDAFCEATSRRKSSDEKWGRGKRPVINVSWNDAIAYCNWLSEKEKLPSAYDNNGNLLNREGKITTDPSKVVGYRLPTEAEWEYAARGGNKSRGYEYAGSDNVDEVAWYIDNSDQTKEFGLKLPNELEIYDMSGNVWEWCSDLYDGGYYTKSPTTNPYWTSGSCRVHRGGSVFNNASYMKVTIRYGNSPALKFPTLGFRICRTSP